MSFPGSIPSFTGFNPAHTLAVDGHAAQHNLEQSEITAVATKIGTGSSAPTSGTILTGTGAGTSSWAQANLTTMVTGVLPVANGGTNTTTSTGTGSVVLGTSPTLSNPTITGGGSWAGSPSLSSPTIADFSNSQHNHTNATNGGKITSAAITSFDTSLTTVSNPYKFRASRSATANTGNGAFAVMACDVEAYDTNNNLVSGVYTAPVTGYYWLYGGFAASAGGSNRDMQVAIFKNGTVHTYGSLLKVLASTNARCVVGGLVPLTAGDTADLRCYGEVTLSYGSADPAECYFGGYLVSQT